MARPTRPWQQIQWQMPPRMPGAAAPPPATDSLQAALLNFGRPFVPNTTPIEEARLLLAAGAEVEHSLLVQYLYAAWSLGAAPAAPRIREIAIQEMCHMITVQNLLLFAGAQPFLDRQDQDPHPATDPFPYSLRPLVQNVLEDFLLAETPAIPGLPSGIKEKMQEISDRHHNAVHPVGLIYAQLYWLFQQDDQPTAAWPEVAHLGFTPGRHIDTFPGAGTAKTFQVDGGAEPKWQAQFDHGGVFQNIDSRTAALDAIAAIAKQGEGLASPTGDHSHFETFFDIFTNTNLAQLPVAKLPTDPFVADQPWPDPAKEANRITQKTAAALCGIFDIRYRILLAAVRGALSRDRTIAADAAVRAKYAGWALDEMLSTIKSLARTILRFPCKDGGNAAQLAAAPTFKLDNFQLPDTAADLDEIILDLHRSSAQAVTAALAQITDAGAKAVLQSIRLIDSGRFPNL
jgi:hypothetical protein